MMRKILLFAAVFASLTLMGLVAGVFWLDQAYRARGPLADGRIVEIERGMTLTAAATRLARTGVIRNEKVFLLGARLFARDLRVRAGEFDIAEGSSPAVVMKTLALGPAVQRRLTIPEGLTSTQVIALIQGAHELSGMIDGNVAEGTLLPETYYVTKSDDRAKVLERMRRAQQDLVAALWSDRDPDLPFESPADAVILASIVEKETAVGGERAMVAGVFINRLRKRIRLQSDPTVIYGLTGGEALGRGLRQSELDRVTPYNTYKFAGLPAGPIANPGRDALVAVLHPEKHGYLYFVADGSGGHVFAETLDEHNRNVRAWRRIERQRQTSP